SSRTPASPGRSRSSTSPSPAPPKASSPAASQPCPSTSAAPAKRNSGGEAAPARSGKPPSKASTSKPTPPHCTPSGTRSRPACANAAAPTPTRSRATPPTPTRRTRRSCASAATSPANSTRTAPPSPGSRPSTDPPLSSRPPGPGHHPARHADTTRHKHSKHAKLITTPCIGATMKRLNVILLVPLLVATLTACGLFSKFIPPIEVGNVFGIGTAEAPTTLTVPAFQDPAALGPFRPATIGATDLEATEITFPNIELPDMYGITLDALWVTLG